MSKKPQKRKRPPSDKPWSSTIAKLRGLKGQRMLRPITLPRRDMTR